MNRMDTEFAKKDRYTMNDLVGITKLLRGENGCPWDKEQTHESIRNNLIEETYETCEAIDLKDVALLKEELGDVLLQVVFHAELEEEQGHFCFEDVCDGICKKLIQRHPHVFSDTVVTGTEQVLETWETIKQESKGQHTQTEAMQSVPKTFPALMRAQKVQKRAGKSGFDYQDVYDAMGGLESELDELQCAIEEEDLAQCSEELGDVLFSAVNVARFLKLDAEQSLVASTEKFMKRFKLVETLAKERDVAMESATIVLLEELWQEAKQQAASEPVI